MKHDEVVLNGVPMEYLFTSHGVQEIAVYRSRSGWKESFTPWQLQEALNRKNPEPIERKGHQKGVGVYVDPVSGMAMFDYRRRGRTAQ